MALSEADRLEDSLASTCFGIHLLWHGGFIDSAAGRLVGWTEGAVALRDVIGDYSMDVTGKPWPAEENGRVEDCALHYLSPNLCKAIRGVPEHERLRVFRDLIAKAAPDSDSVVRMGLELALLVRVLAMGARASDEL